MGGLSSRRLERAAARAQQLIFAFVQTSRCESWPDAWQKIPDDKNEGSWLRPFRHVGSSQRPAGRRETARGQVVTALFRFHLPTSPSHGSTAFDIKEQRRLAAVLTSRISPPRVGP